MRHHLAVITALEKAETLDRAAGLLRAGVHVLPLGNLRERLRDRWVGHPLHPPLVPPAGTR
jgi:hypothetical protein